MTDPRGLSLAGGKGGKYVGCRSPMGAFFSRLWRRVAGADRVLLLALALSFFAGIQGLGWGRYACLNQDAMAFRSIASVPPLHPGNFDKPPLLPYINNVLINEPSKIVANAAIFFGADEHNTNSARWHWRTVCSRFLQWVFYAGLIIFAFLFARDWFGRASARVTAILLGTCSGLVPYKIFLTVDLPTAFFMMACLYLSGRIMRRPESVWLSLAAGACAGLSAAMKYNGLGVAVALPLAHFLAPGGFFAAWKRKSFYLAGIAVPAAFVLANPYSVLDAKNFVGDFMYNYVVTPVYGGETGTGYWWFLTKFPDIFGWPLALLLPVLIAVGLLALFGPGRSDQRRAMFLAAAVFALYYYKIGGFPRVETRFVLPVAPIALLLAAPAWEWLSRWRALLVVLVAPLAFYGMVSGWFVGEMFACDPRMEAIAWARANMPAKVKIESGGSPAWALLEDRDVSVTRIPVGVRRNQIFTELLGDNPWVKVRLAREKEENSADFFTPEALRARNPDYITFTDGYCHDASGTFMQRLVKGEFGYRVVFDKETPVPPQWVYPQNPDFVRARFWILVRD